jgi:hypothetical protein
VNCKSPTQNHPDVEQKERQSHQQETVGGVGGGGPAIADIEAALVAPFLPALHAAQISLNGANGGGRFAFDLEMF